LSAKRFRKLIKRWRPLDLLVLSKGRRKRLRTRKKRLNQNDMIVGPLSQIMHHLSRYTI